MVFEKYKARKAYIKQLRSYSPRELELEHQKLCNPHPPSYDELYQNTSSSSSGGSSREASLYGEPRQHSRTSSTVSSSSSSSSSSS